MPQQHIELPLPPPLISPRKHTPPGTPPTPKNGQHLVCLIAGGPADRYRELKEMLWARRQIEAAHHWDYEKPHAFDREIPKDVDFIFILKTQVSHPLENKVVAAAQRAGTPIVRTTHKWTNLAMALHMRWALPKMSPPLALAPALVESVAEVPAAEPMVELPPAPAPEPELRTQPSSITVPAVVEPVVVKKLRTKFLQTDTVALLRELQARMEAMGIDTILLSRKEVTFT